MPNDNILEDYFSRSDLAKATNKSERTFARYESLGIGPPVTRIGKTPYYRKDAVKKWLQSQEQKRPVRRARA